MAFEGMAGSSLGTLIPGLFFATCAVSSSILYNTCNCYEPPADTKLLTIARLSNIAFMGHACASLLIYAPLGLAIVMVVFENDADPFLIVMCVIYGLIAVSRVATTSTGRIVWPGPNMRNPS